MEPWQVHVDRAHPREALIEPLRVHLSLVPVNEHRIDGHQSEPSPHAQRRQQIGFAQSNHGDVEGAADLQEAGFLEMSDDEAVIARALGFECVADRLRGAAEFRQRMEKVVGWVEPVHLECDAGRCGRVEQRLQALNVRRLLDRMHEALIPQPGGTRRFSHSCVSTQE